MTTLNFETTVNASKDQAWTLLNDFAGISVYHPAVPKSYAINNSSDSGLGAERRCELSNDGQKFIEERIVRHIEGQEYDVEIYGGNKIPPVNNLIVTLGVDAINNSQTRLYITLRYQPKWGPVGTVMNMMMIQPFMSKAMNGILLGFKHKIETGQPVQSFQTLKAAGLVA